MWVLEKCRAAVWGLLLCCSTLAHAQAESPGDGQTINLNQAVTKSLAQNPSLVASGYDLEAQRGRITQAGIRPMIELGVEVENALGNGVYSGFDAAETTLSLAWVLQRGKIEQRVSVARAGLDVLESEAEVQRLDVAAETAELFLDSLAYQERLSLIDQAVALAEQAVEAVGKRVEAGRTLKAERSRAEAALAAVRLEREDIEHELKTSYRRLAAQWAETRPQFTSVQGNIHQLPVPQNFTDLVAQLESNPDLQRYLTLQRLRESELRLVQAQIRPDWRISAGLRRFERTDDHALVAGITIPLGRKNRNQGAVDEAEARLAMTGASELATRVQLETQLFAMYQELEHSLHRAEMLQQQVIPRMEEALKDTERAYALGSYDFVELQVMLVQVLESRSDLVEASIDAHRSVIEIERLTGSPLGISGTDYRGAQ